MAKPIQQTQLPSTQLESLRIFQILVDAGLMDEIPDKGDLPLPDFTPLPAKGKPTSEVIIEDRGEQ
ncbi:hypothetical protein IH992_27630 [Candidatus Poribacteria bacterium]|nr:hypothetical protein [Candidatus Poribacteria bacterium]